MSGVILPGVLQAAAPFIDSYGYIGVGGLLLLEDFGLLVPGETVLVAAAVYAGAGKLNVVALVVVAILCATIGDSIGFAIGHFGGERLIRRFDRSGHRLERVHRFFDHYGGAVVLVARFIDGLRQLNGIIAGTSEMRWRRFLLYNSVGAALWVGTWVSLGYVAGDHIGPIYRAVMEYGVYAIALLAVVLLGAIVRTLYHRRSR
jgi:membrane protein DedA with SNARE-associated domain